MEMNNTTVCPEDIISSSSQKSSGSSNNISIAEQLSRIQRLQEETLRQNDGELGQLRSRLERQQRELSEKDDEIRRLERESYRYQAERTLELERLMLRRGGGSAVNPYQGFTAADGDGGRICHSLIFSSCRRTTPPGQPRQPLRLMDVIHVTILFLLVLQFWNIQSASEYNVERFAPTVTTPSGSKVTTSRGSVTLPKRAEPKKPWESTPPKPIALLKGYNNNSNNSNTRDQQHHNPPLFIERRHACIRAIRERQTNVFEQILLGKSRTPQILLVDPAYHSNVGDHMLTLGELELIQTALKLPKPQQCHYVQANNFFPVCTTTVMRSKENGLQKGSAAGKVALWHAGGNWGDLWPGRYSGEASLGLLVFFLHGTHISSSATIKLLLLLFLLP